MKSYLIALLVALVTTFCANDPAQAAPRRLKGSGNLTTKEVTLPSFQSISASRSVQVELVANQGQATLIEADDNVMEYVIVSVEGNTLKVGISDEVRSISSVHVRVVVPTDGTLNEVKAVAAATIRSEVRLQSDEIELDASSAGHIVADIQAEECEIDLSSAAHFTGEVVAERCSMEASSSANITATLAVRTLNLNLSSAANATLQGAVLNCRAELSSAADLHAPKLVVKHYDIEASSASDATICCLESLKAYASSGADIHYTGNCTNRNIKRSSGGDVTQH